MPATAPHAELTRPPSKEELLSAALSYIERGWPVLPLRPRAKEPLTTHGHRDATLDPDQVTEWWSRWPSANIGIATGEAGLLVVDVDCYKPGLDFDAWLAGREWPDTLTVRTGRGGLQHAFAQPDVPIRSSTGQLHDSIDIRGLGGYIVAPPSMTEQRYTIIREIPSLTVAPPAWLTDELTRPALPISAPPARHRADGWVTAYGSRALDEECIDLERTTTGRNAKLNKVAFRMGQLIAGNHLDADTVERRLHAAALVASGNGDHPLTDREIDRTMHSGLDAGLAHPATNQAPELPAARVPATTTVTRSETLVCQRIETFTAQPPKFLWANRLIVGGITIMAGDGGIGKSYLATNLAVCFARGEGLPEQGPDEQGTTVILSFEDPGEIIFQRARAMGYDPSTAAGSIEVIYGPEAFHDDEGAPRQLTPRDTDTLIDVLRSKPNLKLLIVDPLMSFIGADVDVNKDQQVRAVLHKLVAVAKELSIAVVVVAHVTKGSPDPSRALDAISGSAGIKNISRSAHIVMRDPADGRNFVFHRKHNWTEPASALEYRFTNGHFEWVGTASDSKLELICRRSTATPVDRCVAWLAGLLREGTAASTYVFEKGEEEGFSLNTIRTAQAHLRIEINKTGYQGRSYWSLPSDMS